MTAEQWQRDIDVNLTGAFRTVQACLGGMRERRYGRIIVISSVAASAGCPARWPMPPRRPGQLGMVRTLAAENAALGITVNAILPGLVATEQVLGMPAGGARARVARAAQRAAGRARRDRRGGRVPGRRGGRPDQRPEHRRRRRRVRSRSGPSSRSASERREPPGASRPAGRGAQGAARTASIAPGRGFRGTASNSPTRRRQKMPFNKLTAALAAAGTTLAVAPAAVLAAPAHAVEHARAGTCHVSLSADPHIATSGESVLVTGALKCNGTGRRRSDDHDLRADRGRSRHQSRGHPHDPAGRHLRLHPHRHSSPTAASPPPPSARTARKSSSRSPRR